ncbi:MAG: phosphatase PAP2 family protein [Bacteroidetes bacterium]|nr:phosphatase PAP2 family protein [Bacteroidota bacterium]
MDTLDITILHTINAGRPVMMDGFFRLVSDTTGWIAALVPLVMIVVGFVRKDRATNLVGYKVAAAYLLSVIVANSLKYIIARPRPFVTYAFIQKLSSGGSGSFPSGHTSDAFALATALTLFVPTKRLWIPAFLWGLTVAYSRMDLGVHYPSDVLGGMIVGAGSAAVCWWWAKTKAPGMSLRGGL